MTHLCMSLYNKPLKEVIKILEGRSYELKSCGSQLTLFHDTYIHPLGHKVVIYHDGETLKKAIGYTKGE